MPQPAYRFIADDPEHVPLFDLYTKGDFRVSLPWPLASRLQRALAPCWWQYHMKEWDKLASFMFEPCYLWTGEWTTGPEDKKDGGGGYGKVSWEGRERVAHRVVFECHHGIKLPRHVLLDHLCRNRRCCQPLHL